jgi:hypothetical protein
MEKSLEDTRIGLATAKLAKEKRYDAISKGSITEYQTTRKDPEYPEGGGPFGWTKGELEGSNDYFRNFDQGSDYSNKNYTMYARPTQTVLAKWLREKHGIHVEIYCNASGWGYILTKLNGTTIKEIMDDVFFESAEVAMEVGLVEALNMIKS